MAFENHRSSAHNLTQAYPDFLIFRTNGTKQSGLMQFTTLAFETTLRREAHICTKPSFTGHIISYLLRLAGSYLFSARDKRL